ncbi:ALP1-like protein [Tanacetum coccineum]|uniref:ALP1-like protein n=1 Tax=Tanacetum coccineum TaxID=301880 RepID=A0ABQ5JBL1_9ASTR
MMNTKYNHSKGDMKVEAKSSSSGSCGKFIEVVIMLILIGHYYCFIHGYYCSTTVNTARTKLILLHRILMVDSNTFGQEMVNILVLGEAYDKVFNHLDMLHASLEVKEKDEIRSNNMVDKIERTIKARRQIRRLESYVGGLNNDINVICQLPLLNDLKEGKTPYVAFLVNDVHYNWEYYLTDEIYLEWSVLIKSISHPGTNDTKRIRYKQAHEAARNDVERAFGVLKKK